MRKIFKFTGIAFFVLIIPFSLLTAQEKKTEQKIKIVTSDGSGNKVVIDTTFTGEGPDSIKLKDGSVVHLKHNDGDAMLHDGKHHTIVATYSADSKGEGKEFKEITIVHRDSTGSHHEGDKGDVMIYTNSNPDSNGNVRYEVSSKSDGSSHNKVYYINKNITSDKDTFNIYVTKEDQDSGVDKSRYIIAKDGMVVTVEGTDEAKTQALAKEIEKKLGVTSESGSGKKDKKK